MLFASTTSFLVAVLILLLLGSLAAWAWWSIAHVKKELLSFDGFEGMHLED